MLVILLAILGLLLLYWKKWSHPKKFPPGPKWPLPMIGDSYLLGSDLKVGFGKMRKEYGNVCGFWLGSQRAVMVADFDILQDMLSKTVTNDRQQFAAADLVRMGLSLGTTPGVMFSNGPTWVDMRRTSLHTLRNLGFGKNVMEEVIDDEIDNLIQYIDDNYLDQPLDVRTFFNMAVLASLWRVISGECLKIGDPKFEHLIDMVSKMIEEIGNPLTAIALDIPPLLKFLHKIGVLKFLDCVQDLFNFNLEVVNVHKTRPIDGDNPLTFTEAMLHKIQTTSNQDSPLYGQRGELNLVNVLLDLFMAGSDTSSTTLNWAMLYMIRNPGVQDKVRKELDEVYGVQKPNMDSRTLTPYTEAVIHEIQRRGNIVPSAVFHYTSEEYNFGNFSLPPNTVLIPLIGEVMNDPEHFPNPTDFNPERFLTTENGSLAFKQHPKVIPFGIGKRRCLGEIMARATLYKFFSALVMKYEIVSGQDEPITEESVVGMMNAPVKYLMKFKPRSTTKR